MQDTYGSIHGKK